MKKFFLPLIVFALFVLPGKAQNTFNKGDKVVNLSVGFGNSLYSGAGYKTTIPAIAASYEMGIMDELFDENSSLGVGGYLGYTGAEFNYGPGYGWKYSSVIIGARGSLHYQFIDNLDSYTGLMLGYDIVTTKTFGEGAFDASASGSGLAFSWFLGGRYYLTERIAGLLELGFGVAYVNVGVAIKL